LLTKLAARADALRYLQVSHLQNVWTLAQALSTPSPFPVVQQQAWVIVPTRVGEHAKNHPKKHPTLAAGECRQLRLR